MPNILYSKPAQLPISSVVIISISSSLVILCGGDELSCVEFVCTIDGIRGLCKGGCGVNCSVLLWFVVNSVVLIVVDGSDTHDLVFVLSDLELNFLISVPLNKNDGILHGQQTYFHINACDSIYHSLWTKENISLCVTEKTLKCVIEQIMFTEFWQFLSIKEE